jgi:hypothetical protein
LLFSSKVMASSQDRKQKHRTHQKFPSGVFRKD